MGLSIGIVGLPNVGKSTLFNALTKKSVDVANYPFCTIDPSVGVVSVPDARLQALATLSKSEKVLPAAIEFVDIAGLVAGASQGEGLGNQFLSHIREVDAIAHVVRIFEDDDITHVAGSIDPLRDIETIHLELILADLSVAEKRYKSALRDAKGGDKEAKEDVALLERIIPVLTEERLASSITYSDAEKRVLRRLNLLTTKPLLFVFNKKNGAKNLDEHDDASMRELLSYVHNLGAQAVTVDAGIEHELRELDDTEKGTFRSELGSSVDGIDALIKAGYALLSLITFFTTGEKETRAWTIKTGSSAPEAGAAIHSDFKDRFIRAEVIGYEELCAEGSYTRAREKGLVRTEGKTYIVSDGDVIEFKI